MSEVDLKKLLKICKNKIDNKENIFDFIEINFSDSLSNEEMSKLKKEINDYLLFKEEQLVKNQKYWMLICNSLKWGEGEEPFRVNQLLYDLDEVSWTINKNADITHKMKKGHQGIIKMSKDERTENDRFDDKGNIVDKLLSGIYGVFEVVENEDGNCTYEVENGDWYVNIKIIHNFYINEKIVQKEKAEKYLGEDIFRSYQSREILEKSYFDIIEFQKTL